jgi:hypothetical protein
MVKDKIRISAGSNRGVSEHLLGLSLPTDGLGAARFPEEAIKAQKSLEISTLNSNLFFLKTFTLILMALVFRKVESRTSNKFKLIISQLMKETEFLAKNISEELGKFYSNSW